MKKRATILGCLLLICMICENMVFARAGSKFVVVMLNSPTSIVDNNIGVIDRDNFDIKVISENGRTLAPLRFISEVFGAKVSFDALTDQVNVRYKTNLAKFNIGSDEMIINGEISKMDVEAKIIEGKTYIPLRKLVEDVLVKKIYFESDVITIAETEDILKTFKGKEATTLIKRVLDVNRFAGLVQLQKPIKGDVVATMKTNRGEIRIKLFPKEAPKAVENFIQHAEAGYYNDLSFHRVIQDFMIQGGDPNGNGTGGQSIWGVDFGDEFDAKLLHIRGALSMANSGENTNRSQFFIVQNSKIDKEYLDKIIGEGMTDWKFKLYEKMGGTPHLDNRNTVFGQVYEGLSVVDKIAQVKTDQNNKPLELVKIIDISIENID